jgi:hypothetical protein
MVVSQQAKRAFLRVRCFAVKDALFILRKKEKDL